LNGLILAWKIRRLRVDLLSTARACPSKDSKLMPRDVDNRLVTTMIRQAIDRFSTRRVRLLK
jgi:hypothetical protein